MGGHHGLGMQRGRLGPPGRPTRATDGENHVHHIPTYNHAIHILYKNVYILYIYLSTFTVFNLHDMFK